MSLILVIILRVLINNCKCYKCYFLAYETQNPHSIKTYICYKICNLATVHFHFWECTVATLYNILLFLILSLLRLSYSPSHSLILPHNLGIISLPFHHATCILKLICSPLSFKGLWSVIMVMIWWVSWVWFGGYWWCSTTVLMGLRSGWWVLAGVEIEVGGWWWVLLGLRSGWVGGGFCGGGDGGFFFFSFFFFFLFFFFLLWFVVVVLFWRSVWPWVWFWWWVMSLVRLSWVWVGGGFG